MEATVVDLGNGPVHCSSGGLFPSSSIIRILNALGTLMTLSAPKL